MDSYHMVCTGSSNNMVAMDGGCMMRLEREIGAK